MIVIPFFNITRTVHIICNFQKFLDPCPPSRLSPAWQLYAAWQNWACTSKTTQLRPCDVLSFDMTFIWYIHLFFTIITGYKFMFPCSMLIICQYKMYLIEVFLYMRQGMFTLSGTPSSTSYLDVFTCLFFFLGGGGLFSQYTWILTTWARWRTCIFRTRYYTSCQTVGEIYQGLVIRRPRQCRGDYHIQLRQPVIYLTYTKVWEWMCAVGAEGTPTRQECMLKRIFILLLFL